MYEELTEEIFSKWFALMPPPGMSQNRMMIKLDDMRQAPGANVQYIERLEKFLRNEFDHNND